MPPGWPSWRLSPPDPVARLASLRRRRILDPGLHYAPGYVHDLCGIHTDAQARSFRREIARRRLASWDDENDAYRIALPAPTDGDDSRTSAAVTLTFSGYPPYRGADLRKRASLGGQGISWARGV